MIDLRRLDRYRDREWQASVAARFGTPFGPEDLGGCFRFFVRKQETKELVEIRCIAANGDGWDHVSVSTGADRCPHWDEMERVKRLFFARHEVAMQLHVAPVDHISHHPHCLHIWRPHGMTIPLPPKWMIA